MSGNRRDVGVTVAAVVVTVLAAASGRAVAAVKVLVVGDSISQGSSGDYTWRYRLWLHLQATAPGAVDFVGGRTDLFNNVTNQHGSQAYRVSSFDRQHHATWGRLLSDEKQTIGAAVTDSGADVMLVMLGINDVVWLGLTASQVEAEMRQLIANARAARPGVDIVVGHLLARYDPWTGQVLNQATVSAVNARYDALAADLSTPASRISTAATDASWLPKNHTWDGTHPNSTGEVRIAAAFANALAQSGIGAPYGTVPVTVTWPAPGRQPTAVPQDGAVGLSWPAVPGATGYFIEQKIVSFGETSFSRLPYPVGGTSWTAGLLPPGGVVQHRVVPSKGLMTGVAGPSVQATVGGSPPSGRPTLTGYPLTEHDGRLTWTAVPNATGYYIWVADLTPFGFYNWQRLPWAVSGTSFDPGLLHSGHWHAFFVVPVNGFIEGPASNTVEFRTKGIPYTPSAGNAYLNYYALGDSYSSGLGAGGSAGYTGGDCRRTTNAWPYWIGFVLNVHHLACAGETIAGLRASQLPQLGPLHHALITVTIGGNDAGFPDGISTCTDPGQGDCSWMEPAIAARIDALKPELVSLYRTLRQMAPGADIVAGGYPKLVMPPGTGDCSWATNTVLKDEEKLMIRRLATRMNNVIDQAAQQAGIMSAVPQILAEFDGHEACSTNGEFVNQTAAGAIPIDWSGSFHPNAGGQFAYGLAFNDRLVAAAQSGMVR